MGPCGLFWVRWDQVWLERAGFVSIVEMTGVGRWLRWGSVLQDFGTIWREVTGGVEGVDHF